jgi:hypothetical protein
MIVPTCFVERKGRQLDVTNYGPRLRHGDYLHISVSCADVTRRTANLYCKIQRNNDSHEALAYVCPTIENGHLKSAGVGHFHSENTLRKALKLVQRPQSRENNISRMLQTASGFVSQVWFCKSACRGRCLSYSEDACSHQSCRTGALSIHSPSGAFKCLSVFRSSRTAFSRHPYEVFMNNPENIFKRVPCTLV